MKKRFAALCLTCSALLSLSAPAAAVRAPNDSGQPQSSTGNTSVTIPSDGTLSFDQIGPRVKANNLTLKAAQESLKSAEAMDWDEAIDEMEDAIDAIKGGRITAEVLKKALAKFIEEIEKAEKQASQPKTYRGKQSIKHLVEQNAAISNIEVTDGNIKSFERTANKYGIDYALKKDTSEQPPRYLVFFKGRDVDVMTQAFKEFSAKTVKQKEKQSLKQKLSRSREQSKAQHKEKVKVKTKDRGVEL